MSEENKAIEIGDWKIELIDRSGHYTLGRVFHAGVEMRVHSLEIRMVAHQLVTLKVDGVWIDPTGEKA